jgi:pyruvate ferredoxin oxidoreductase alpha subunit
MDAIYIRVESEHNGNVGLHRSCAYRLTSGYGYKLKRACAYERNDSSRFGIRAPIVMPVVNRAIAAPWSLWCEHMDTMSSEIFGMDAVFYIKMSGCFGLYNSRI